MLNQCTKKEYHQCFLQNDNKNMEAIGDYTHEKEDFYYQNLDRRKMFICKLNITIEDNAKLKFNKYGAESIVKNGLKIYYTTNGGVKKYIIDNTLPIKSNKDWLNYSCNVEEKYFNNNHSFLRISFDFSKQNNYIILDKTEKIVVELNDDYNGLENHTFHIEGFMIKL